MLKAILFASCEPGSWLLLRLQAAAKASLAYKEVPLEHSAPIACDSQGNIASSAYSVSGGMGEGTAHSSTAVTFDGELVTPALWRRHRVCPSGGVLWLSLALSHWRTLGTENGT